MKNLNYLLNEEQIKKSQGILLENYPEYDLKVYRICHKGFVLRKGKVINQFSMLEYKR